MDFTSISISTIVATSAMTAFSYIYSSIVNRQFREPELLNILVIRWSDRPQNLSKNSLVGWFIHYFVGLVFIVVFYMLWEKMQIDATLLSGVSFGFLAGMVGVTGWQLTFWIHPNPPDLNFKHYYIHLILAHVIFGVSGLITFNWLN